MKTLIIHLGPPKCGSSSIQSFFNSYKKPCTQKIKFIEPDAQTIDLLNSEKEIGSSSFGKLLDKKLRATDQLILSHERFYKSPGGIKKICSYVSSKVSRVFIIGYSRRASDFLVSGYNQWGFREGERAVENSKTLLQNKINPLHFLGVERQLIAFILDDFNFRNPPTMNWDKCYGEIEERVAPLNAEIKVGILPTKNSSIGLIQDFCNKAGLTLRDKHKNSEHKSNPKFNSYLTEAVHNAMENGIGIPGPHDDNEALHELSTLIDSELNQDNKFLFVLKEYIDSYFYESNLKFCKKYNLDQNYFEIDKTYSKEEILALIRSEEQQRIIDNTMLKKHKEIAGQMARACIDLLSKKK